jgi:hypothetical protein
LNKSFKGYASEYLVMFDLLAKGIDAFLPCRPDLAYDLKATINGRDVKIQVKTGNRTDETITADIRKPPKNRESTYYENDEYDLLAVTDLESRKVAYISPGEFKRSITFRIEPQRVGNQFKQRMFDDFLDMPNEIGNHSAIVKEAM